SPVRWREAEDDAFIGLSPKPGETDLAIVSFANGPFWPAARKARFQVPLDQPPCTDIAPPQRRCFCARLGGRNSDRRRWALYSNLRFVASASLVALARVTGVLAVYPYGLEQLLVAER